MIDGTSARKVDSPLDCNQVGKIKLVELSKWITTREAAEILGVSMEGVHYLLREDNGRGAWTVRVMNFGTEKMPRYRIHKDDVQALADKRNDS